MLNTATVAPTIPVTDLARAKAFYGKTLGLTEKPEWSDASNTTYLAGDGTYLSLYQRGPTEADHTLAEFWVDNLETEMDELRHNGITFEEYDIPEMGLKTVDGIATMGAIRVAWFRDPDGNILAVGELVK